MKKYALLLLFVIFLALAGWWFVASQNKSIEEESATTTQSAMVPVEWQTYTNMEYGFSVAHPLEWEVQESLKPQELRATHEVMIWEKEYEMWRSSVAIRMFENGSRLSVREWWNVWLEEEDAKGAECRKEYGDTAPCLYLRGLVAWEREATVAGEDAITVGLFRFDHEEECTYVARGTTVFGLCAAGDNPNDAFAQEHRTITNAIQESFSWLES